MNKIHTEKFEQTMIYIKYSVFLHMKYSDEF